MWLPADERKLLAGLYRSIGKVGGEYAYREDSLARLLHGEDRVPEYGEEPEEPHVADFGTLQLAIQGVIANRQRVATALEVLLARSLITLDRHESEVSVVIVALTLQGYDLGWKYSSWLTRSHLWWPLG